ncbi:hypothetical protein [Mycobacterium uberis]|uniref:hypothetical protein n=1 Tax=Mycobacterium uberis TaxID=2162698 RepID=UPI0010590956|nr:hypothetical protein [Mycobacterium uberis]
MTSSPTARIGSLGLGATPQRAKTVEAAIIRKPVREPEPEETGQEAMTELDDVPADLHTDSACYHTQVGAPG